jgi:hypothetical protein
MECVNQVIFTYTGEPCDANIGSNGSLPVATCSRSATARVIVSDTAGTLYDKHCSIGTDIVVANSGACLASNLQVQVLQPMSNTATTKLLDTRCTNVNDITLLDSFGVVDFTLATAKTKSLTTVLLMSLTISSSRMLAVSTSTLRTLTLHSRMSRRTCS